LNKKDILLGDGAINEVCKAPCPRQGSWIVTIIQPVGQDATPAKNKNKLCKMAVIFIDI
tara:strand:+ start:827 stop:1003 length:177 start_codon:yes stop_codon:yes gene_type:complete